MKNDKYCIKLGTHEKDNPVEYYGIAAHLNLGLDDKTDIEIEISRKLEGTTPSYLSYKLTIQAAEELVKKLNDFVTVAKKFQSEYE